MSDTATIYLFRHGETEWNAQGRRQGHLDSPLTQKGRFQARENASRLRRKRPIGDGTVVYASPLGRAQQTAAIMIEALGLPDCRIVREPRLKECSFGSWEGLTTAEIETRFPDEWAARARDCWHVAAPNGESYADVHARVSDWYLGLTLAGTTIVVCHGLTSRVFRGIYSGLSHRQVFDLDESQDGFYELRDGASAFVG